MLSMSLESLRNAVESQEAELKSAEDMTDAELLVWHRQFLKKVEKEQSGIEDKINQLNDERKKILKPVYDAVEALVEDPEQFPDEETFNQMKMLNVRTFPRMTKLDSEEVIANYGKAIVYLNKIGVLSNDSAEHLTALDVELDALDVQYSDVESPNESEAQYSKEYSKRELYFSD